MFMGTYPYKVDEKGRMPLPRKFREQLKKEKGGVLTKGVDKCIDVYSLISWNKYIKGITSRKKSPRDQRKLNRAIFVNVFSLRFDGQGRIALPAELRDYAEIIGSAIVIGCGNYIEIWNEELGKVAITEAEDEREQIENMGWEHE